MNVLLAILAFAGPPFGAALAWWLNSRSEERQRTWALQDRARQVSLAHETWLRDLRRAHYASLLAADNEVGHEALMARYPLDETAEVHKARTIALVTKFHSEYAQVILLCSDVVREATDDLRLATVESAGSLMAGGSDNINEAVHEARQKFVTAAKMELQITETPGPVLRT